MLHPFSTFACVNRQQRALFRSLARWQNTPTRDLGEFGLSVTTNISNPTSGAVTVQFSLHHQYGGIHQSGIISFSDDGYGYLDWISEAATPILREFLLSSALSGNPWRTPSVSELLLDGVRIGA